MVFSGSDKIAYSKITFKFRNKDYTAIRKNGKFELTRVFDSIKDVLNNDYFERFINHQKQKLPKKEALKYANSVNSVHYFSVLPFGLNDKAVNKKLLKSSTFIRKRIL